MLDSAIGFLRSEVAPRAAELDRDVSALKDVVAKMGAKGFAALRVPQEFGGPGFPEEDFRSFQEEAARASRRVAFLQTQHQSAASMILRSEKQELKERVLPDMVTGKRWIGIGFSQLRRKGPPIMRATPSEGGYILDGTVPWITGYGIYPEFLIGAALPDGDAVFGIVPLQNVEGKISVSPVMQLAAMESAQTVSAEFSGYFLPEEDVAFVKPLDWLASNDMVNITLQGHFAIGCARAGLDILENNANTKKLDFLKEAYDSLFAEWQELREKIRKATPSADERTTQERLELRAHAIELANRCALAAVTSSSGAANSMNHPAQRVYREALVFTVSAQTTAIMEATLLRLRRS